MHSIHPGMLVTVPAKVETGWCGGRCSISRLCFRYGWEGPHVKVEVAISTAEQLKWTTPCTSIDIELRHTKFE